MRIINEDYLSTIISSLPNALSNFASMQMSWMLQQTSEPMDANTLITMLLQEADRQNLWLQRHKQGSEKGKDEEKDEALPVSTDKLREKRDTSKIKCWNFREMGHFRSKCPKPKKSKDASETTIMDNPTQKKEGTSGTANAVETTSDKEGAWAGEVMLSGDWLKEAVEAGDDDMPDLVEASDGEDEDVAVDDEQRFEEVEDKVEGIEVEQKGCETETDKLIDEEGAGNITEEFGDMSGEDFIIAESIQTAGTAELYDSWCKNHISPYKNQFQSFKPITPRHFHAANKQTFSMIGRGACRRLIKWQWWDHPATTHKHPLFHGSWLHIGVSWKTRQCQLHSNNQWTEMYNQEARWRH